MCSEGKIVKRPLLGLEIGVPYSMQVLDGHHGVLCITSGLGEDEMWKSFSLSCSSSSSIIVI